MRRRIRNCPVNSSSEARQPALSPPAATTPSLFASSPMRSTPTSNARDMTWNTAHGRVFPIRILRSKTTTIGRLVSSFGRASITWASPRLTTRMHGRAIVPTSVSSTSPTCPRTASIFTARNGTPSRPPHTSSRIGHGRAEKEKSRPCLLTLPTPKPN